MQTIATIGFDIAKSVFQVHGVDAGGQVVIERSIPAVDSDAELDLKVGGEQDECGAENGPGMRRIYHPCAGEYGNAEGKIEIEPERPRRPEQCYADNAGGRRPDEIIGEAIPECHRQCRPGDGRQKERFRAGKK